MFTLEIDGLAVAVINGDEETARDLFTCDGFKEDIRTMKSGGRPIWNGTSALKVRAASEDEVEEFEDALAADDSEDEEFEPDPRHDAASEDGQEDDDEENEADIVFLVEIDDEDGPLDA